MTTTIGDVRQALADAISSTGFRCYPYVVDGFAAPCGMVDRRAMDPRMVFDAAKNVYQFRVICYFGRTAEVAGQKAMDERLDPTGDGSIIAAIRDGANWPDELVDYADVILVGDTYERQLGDLLYLAVDLTIEVCW